MWGILTVCDMPQSELPPSMLSPPHTSLIQSFRQHLDTRVHGIQVLNLHRPHHKFFGFEYLKEI